MLRYHVRAGVFASSFPSQDNILRNIRHFLPLQYRAGRYFDCDQHFPAGAEYVHEGLIELTIRFVICCNTV